MSLADSRDEEIADLRLRATSNPLFNANAGPNLICPLHGSSRSVAN